MASCGVPTCVRCNPPAQEALDCTIRDAIWTTIGLLLGSFFGYAGFWNFSRVLDYLRKSVGCKPCGPRKQVISTRASKKSKRSSLIKDPKESAIKRKRSSSSSDEELLREEEEGDKFISKPNEAGTSVDKIPGNPLAPGIYSDLETKLSPYEVTEHPIFFPDQSAQTSPTGRSPSRQETKQGIQIIDHSASSNDPTSIESKAFDALDNQPDDVEVNNASSPADLTQNEEVRKASSPANLTADENSSKASSPADLKTDEKSRKASSPADSKPESPSRRDSVKFAEDLEVPIPSIGKRELTSNGTLLDASDQFAAEKPSIFQEPKGTRKRSSSIKRLNLRGEMTTKKPGSAACDTDRCALNHALLYPRPPYYRPDGSCRKCDDTAISCEIHDQGSLWAEPTFGYRSCLSPLVNKKRRSRAPETERIIRLMTSLLLSALFLYLTYLLFPDFWAWLYKVVACLLNRLMRFLNYVWDSFTASDDEPGTESNASESIQSPLGQCTRQQSIY